MMDIEPGLPLEAIDPAAGDPTYWDRFQNRVLRAAGPALELRRQAAEITMSGVLASWSRLVVPAALVAAAAAGLLLVQPPEASEAPPPLLGLEDLLAPHWGDGPDALPAFLVSEEPVDREAVLVAVEGR